MRGRDLKAARLRLGLTQEALAKALGMSAVQLSRYENGHMPVPRVVALAVEALERRQQTASSPKRAS